MEGGSKARCGDKPSARAPFSATSAVSVLVAACFVSGIAACWSLQASEEPPMWAVRAKRAALSKVSAAIDGLLFDLEEQVEGRMGDREGTCQLHGKVADCKCSYSQVDRLNAEVVLPQLSDLVETRYFRYFKADLGCKCPFWTSHHMCAHETTCRVCVCEDEDEELLGMLTEPVCLPGEEGRGMSQAPSLGETREGEGRVDLTLKDLSVGEAEEMQWPEVTNPWLSPEIAERQAKGERAEGGGLMQSQYVNLLLNKERFTGYEGEAAHRVWGAIYGESCFEGIAEMANMTRQQEWDLDDPDADDEDEEGEGQGGGGPPAPQVETCKEKQVFYRLVSGLHSSITAHIAADHPYEICTSSPSNPGASMFMGMPASQEPNCKLDFEQWGPNLELFYQRLGKPALKQRVENLYFVYLFTLQAAIKAKSYLLGIDYSTGMPQEDAMTKTMVRNLLDSPRMSQLCPDAFDESVLWTGEDAGEMKLELMQHYHNITRLLDCVDCEKCKLWGKLQFQGLATALKILFSVNDIKNLVLQRNEVIAFVNLLHKLSHSIQTSHLMACTLSQMKGYEDVVTPSSCWPAPRDSFS